MAKCCFWSGLTILSRVLTGIVLMLFCQNILFAQHNIVFKPTINLGVGMFSYYGELSKNQPTHNPIISRIGYNLKVTQQVNHFVDGSFYVLFGSVGANERSLTRNLNFDSKITTGGFSFIYNFHHVMPEDREVEPYVSLGIESFEFLSKTDLIDASGNPYFYWSDGSIRNLDENDPEASSATVLQRDFVYESDIRELNLDGFGKYPERSFAIPIGVGFNMHLTDHFKFKVGTEFHYTFTDMVDGVTPESLGARQGDKGKDHFLYSSFSLSYNLVIKGEPEDTLIFDPTSDYELMVNNYGDYDGDGVIDFFDKCAHTPKGIEVDAKGCPFDDDNDGVANHEDKELETADSAHVDHEGVTISDEKFAEFHARREDSLGVFVEMDEKRTQHLVEVSGGAGGSKGTTTFKATPDRFLVKIGDSPTARIDKDLAEKLLGIPGLKVVEEGKATFYIIDNIQSLDEALKKELELAGMGITGTVGFADSKGHIATVDKKGRPIDAKPVQDPTGVTLYRVQLGAFTQRMSKNIFTGIPNLVYVVPDDNVVRYYSGSFNSMSDAATHKADMLLEGFSGAFVVAFKNGKRVSLGEAGATPIPGREDAVNTMQDDSKITTVSPDLIKFKVQVGAFKSDIPTNILEIFTEIGNIEQESTGEGLIRYMSGQLNSYEEAMKYRDELRAKGIAGAFVIGRFKGKTIPVEEAMKLLGK